MTLFHFAHFGSCFPVVSFYQSLLLVLAKHLIMATGTCPQYKLHDSNLSPLEFISVKLLCGALQPAIPLIFFFTYLEPRICAILESRFRGS